MRNSIKTQGGFSLIELMVVVGIIGILASIAVPQFSKFQAKARQSEAKTSLAALYTAEKGFFSEYTVYTIDVGNAGFGIEGASLRYDVGFPSATNADCYAAAAGLPPQLGVNADRILAGGSLLTSGAFKFARPVDIGAVAGHCPAAGPPSFIASAYGNPNNAAVANNNGDQWTINQIKTLANSANGIL